VYALLQSHISDHVSFKAKAEVMQMMQGNQEMMMLSQQDPEQFEIMFQAEVAKVAARITTELVQAEMQQAAGKQDPLIKIKQQEVDLRAMDLQRKAEETRFKAEQENMRQAQKLDLEYNKLQQQDEQSDERLDIARQKLQQS
jgi:hypothetical protein